MHLHQFQELLGPVVGPNVFVKDYFYFSIISIILSNKDRIGIKILLPDNI